MADVIWPSRNVTLPPDDVKMFEIGTELFVSVYTASQLIITSPNSPD